MDPKLEEEFEAWIQETPITHPFKCICCSIRFQRMFDAKNHYLETHSTLTIDWRDICLPPECENPSQGVHERKKPQPQTISYICQHCFYPFQNKVILEKHILKSHAQERKPFNCSLCQKSFDKEGNLASHIQTAEHLSNMAES